MSLREKALALLGTWSWPPDAPAKIALGLAAVLAIVAATGGGRWLAGADPRADADAAQGERRRFLALVAFAAALASVGYVAVYLRGGPRIVDATTYFLQGRALAHGDLAWTAPPGPSASYAGRFLIRRELGDATALGGIFPPGYPLLVALGFLLGAPMVVGPLLAAALVVATYRLARTLADEAMPDRAEPVARAAALLSLACVALRYHTADTMSHGASALGVTLALTGALRARRGPHRLRAALASGLATGYVFATRPASALAIGAVVAWLLTLGVPRTARSARPALVALAGAVPGVLLLLLSQRAVTGSWLASTQRMYYALSDGPPGCFRWGFGAGVGCVHEHGDFVAARLEDGYGLVEAAGTTLRRLHAHLLDVANLEPLALLVLAPVALRSRHVASGGVVVATALVGLHVLAYAPFYFDGSYPGGGARFFADVLPVEHALVVIGLASLLPARADALRRGAFALLAASLAGFAVHGAYEHGRLRDRDGGRPMFEPDVLTRAAVTRGLVFVETDHGFALGHDPYARPGTGVVVARKRGDARDRMLYDALGGPPSWLYALTPGGPSGTSTPSLTPWMPFDGGPSLRLEAEAEWPALAQDDGRAIPTWVDACASGKQALVVTPEPHRLARATITLPVPSAGDWSIEPHVVRVDARGPNAPNAADGAASIASIASITVEGERWEVPRRAGPPCAMLGARVVPLRPPVAEVVLEAASLPLGVDAFTMQKLR